MHQLHDIKYIPSDKLFYVQRNYWHTPYTFSAKERDMETGYSYFGARYYDADISVWLSVDPMADKYPSMSAYMYCAGNPVKLIDPDGREIEINYINWLGKEKTIQYRPGMRSFGRNRFVKQTIIALDNIREVANYVGGNKVDDLVKSEIKTKITERSELGSDVIDIANYYNSISWNPYQVDDYGNENYQSAIVGLAHELEHGHKYMELLERAINSDDDNDWSAVKEFQILASPYSSYSDWLAEENRAIGGLESAIAQRFNQYQRKGYVKPIRCFLSNNCLSTKEK